MSIVKVQLPLFSTDQSAPVLIYDRYCVRMSQQPITNEIRAAMRRDLKAYFYGQWDNEKKTWALGVRAPDQDW